MAAAFVLLPGCTEDPPADETAEGSATAHGEAPPNASDDAPDGGEPAFGSDRDAWFVQRAACLRSLGWDAELTDDGLEVPSVTAGQREVFQEALAECDDRHGPAPAPEPLGEAEIRLFYERALETAECLRARGYEVEDAPSVDRFVESWEDGPWHPYLGLDIPVDEWEDLEDVCPQPSLD